MPETRPIVQPNLELNATNINRKGATPYRKIGLPLDSFCNYESNHHFAATISFGGVSITASSQVLAILCGKIDFL